MLFRTMCFPQQVVGLIISQSLERVQCHVEFATSCSQLCCFFWVQSSVENETLHRYTSFQECILHPHLEFHVKTKHEQKLFYPCHHGNFRLSGSFFLKRFSAWRNPRNQSRSVKIFILRDRGPVPWKPWDRNCKDIRLRDNGWDLTLTSKQCHTMNKSYLEIVLYSIFLVPKWHPHSNWLWTVASRIWCIKHNLSSINFSVCQSLWAAIKSINFLLGESCFLLLPFRLRCELEYQQQIADALTSYSKVLETATFSLLEAHQTLIDSWP